MDIFNSSSILTHRIYKLPPTRDEIYPAHGKSEAYWREHEAEWDAGQKAREREDWDDILAYSRKHPEGPESTGKPWHVEYLECLPTPDGHIRLTWYRTSARRGKFVVKHKWMATKVTTLDRITATDRVCARWKEWLAVDHPFEWLLDV